MRWSAMIDELDMPNWSRIVHGKAKEERRRVSLLLEEIAEKLIGFSSALLDNTSGGIIAGIGIIFLLWAVIKVLSSIEHSFNEIWGVTTSRIGQTSMKER